MTTTHNSQSDHLSKHEPSFWVVRHQGAILSYHAKSRNAVKWLNSHTPDQSMREAINSGYVVSKSYTAEARFVATRTPKLVPSFAPEWEGEYQDFADAINGLNGWIHRSWEQDRDNHPSPTGRQQVWERWHDVSALVHIAELTLLENPGFQYNFGPLTPVGNRGYNLVVSAYPTPESVLQQIVRHHV